MIIIPGHYQEILPGLEPYQNLLNDSVKFMLDKVSGGKELAGWLECRLMPLHDIDSAR